MKILQLVHSLRQTVIIQNVIKKDYKRPNSPIKKSWIRPRSECYGLYVSLLLLVMSPAAAPATNETMISQLLCLKAKKKKQEYFFINGSKQKRLKTVRLAPYQN